MSNHEEEDPRQTLEKDAVWKLLLQARKPEASPFFARNVVREVRQLAEKEEKFTTRLGTEIAGLLSHFTLRRIATAGAFAAIIIAVIFQVTAHRSTTPAGQEIAAPSPPVKPSAEADASTFEISDYEDELEMIDYLDGLLAVQDVNALNDEALAELLF